MPQILTLPVPGRKRQSAWSSMTLPPANVFAVWAVVSGPAARLRPPSKIDYTTGTDSSSRYSANAMQLNKSCYITLSKDPGCHQMVCYGLWKTTMTVMTGHWSPWATSRPVRCPKSCVEATSLSTERGGGTAVKLDTFVALEHESTMSLLSYRQNKAFAGLTKARLLKGQAILVPIYLKFAWDDDFLFSHGFAFSVACNVRLDAMQDKLSCIKHNIHWSGLDRL